MTSAREELSEQIVETAIKWLIWEHGMTRKDAATCLAQTDFRRRERQEAIDVAYFVETITDETERLRIELDGAQHNRFYDQRDAYFEGIKDAKD